MKTFTVGQRVYVLRLNAPGSRSPRGWEWVAGMYSGVSIDYRRPHEVEIPGAFVYRADPDVISEEDYAKLALAT